MPREKAQEISDKIFSSDVPNLADDESFNGVGYDGSGSFTIANERVRHSRDRKDLTIVEIATKHGEYKTVYAVGYGNVQDTFKERPALFYIKSWHENPILRKNELLYIRFSNLREFNPLQQ